MIKTLKIILVIVIILFIGYKLEFSGYLYHNDIFANSYKIKGLDVSHHQVSINWSKINNDKYKFVIMKATEGKNFLDRDFSYNWDKAQLKGFRVGAYHFFSMLSTGVEQAKFYISKVPKLDDSLPPVIDLEIPTKYDKDVVLKELNDMITILENHYEKRVIIYVTSHTYEAYIKGEFLDNPLWVRNIKFYPNIEEDERWEIWQYSNRGRVKGVTGFVDKNVLKESDIDKFINKYRIGEK